MDERAAAEATEGTETMEATEGTEAMEATEAETEAEFFDRGLRG
jgi:hypothetical protein